MSDRQPTVIVNAGPVDDATQSGSAPPTALPAVCPVCGAETEGGYGLAGGGIGSYVACTADGCEFFAKTQDPDALEPEAASL